ncbi:MAG: hypothetical protein AB7F89_20105 [Pirellulaceae bacterium]
MLVAHAAIGGVVPDGERQQHFDALYAAQRSDGGWSIATFGNWRRADGKPLDPELSDGYPTGMVAYALARNGVDRHDVRMSKAIHWLKTHQRLTGGWFTQSPFKRDILASNTGTSWAVQALAACGEIPRPRVTASQFAAAYEAADRAVPEGTYVPNPRAPEAEKKDYAAER